MLGKGEKKKENKKADGLLSGEEVPLVSRGWGRGASLLVAVLVVVNGTLALAIASVAVPRVSPTRGKAGLRLGLRLDQKLLLPFLDLECRPAVKITDPLGELLGELQRRLVRVLKLEKPAGHTELRNLLQDLDGVSPFQVEPVHLLRLRLEVVPETLNLDLLLGPTLPRRNLVLLLSLQPLLVLSRDARDIRIRGFLVDVRETPLRL